MSKQASLKAFFGSKAAAKGSAGEQGKSKKKRKIESSEENESSAPKRTKVSSASSSVGSSLSPEQQKHIEKKRYDSTVCCRVAV